MKEFDTICILGLGYIGLPTAAMFANHGKKIIGVDVSQRVLKALRSGNSPIHEPGIQEILTKAFKSGNFIVQEKPSEADAFIVAVPTPFYGEKKADMRAVISATEAIVPVLKSGNLVILESTSPPRTTIDLMVPILERSGLKAGVDFYLAYSPERVLPGRILIELVENDRVIGGITPASAQAGKKLYSTVVKGEIMLTDATTAEMVKLMENTYRDVNIAIANEFSRLADRFGIDVWEAISIANHHPRVKILHPGPGVGGHCISVDPWFLVEAAPDLANLIRTARQTNDSQPHFVVDMTRKMVGDLKGVKVAALGLAFKQDVDDCRESPAVEAVHLFTKEGAVVKAHEPYKKDAEIEGVQNSPTLEEAVKDAEVIVILAAHQPFAALEASELAQMTKARKVVDTGNIWSADEWKAAGFKVVRVGNGKKE